MSHASRSCREAGTVSKQRALPYRENMTDVYRHGDKTEKIVSVATLVSEVVLVLNFSPIKDFTTGSRELQVVEGSGRTLLRHFMQRSASPASSLTALTDNPHLQRSGLLGT